MAHRQRRRLLPGDETPTTVLAHDLCKRLEPTRAQHDGSQFLRHAAREMRHIIVDVARKQQTHPPAAVDARDPDAFEAADALWLDGGEERIVALDEAVTRLSAKSPCLADVVNCRFFAGYSDADTARALGLSEPGVRREWAKARAWLYREIGPDL